MTSMQKQVKKSVRQSHRVVPSHPTNFAVSRDSPALTPPKPPRQPATNDVEGSHQVILGLDSQRLWQKLHEPIPVTPQRNEHTA